LIDDWFSDVNLKISSKSNYYVTTILIF